MARENDLSVRLKEFHSDWMAFVVAQGYCLNHEYPRRDVDVYEALFSDSHCRMTLAKSELGKSLSLPSFVLPRPGHLFGARFLAVSKPNISSLVLKIMMIAIRCLDY